MTKPRDEELDAAEKEAIAREFQRTEQDFEEDKDDSGIGAYVNYCPR